MHYLCIHAHFYQPPRENPWLEAIELQDTAYPYHDWNERITAECYAPNLSARILDSNQRIAHIVSNYANISFNVGPTLLSWMKDQAPELYEGILEADRSSQKRFGGHGSAMAQCYNHIIMPLANSRDKRTQIRWGIEDFEHRFQRKPEGMWLPETAVDLETLAMLAEEGIRFTILTPYQALAIRPLGGEEWENVDGGRIDTTRPYRLETAPGQSIAIFFYDGPASRAVAFERLLDDGASFANRLVGSFSSQRTRPQLVHIATDGETYGHHHRYGEMALAFALRYIEEKGLARITNYGEFLELSPPVHEVQIHENTSWSCAHGVGRWSNDCGCNTGGNPGYRQTWRAPLRAAFDALRDELVPLYEARAGELFHDPWEARNDYVQVVLDRSPETRRRFEAKHFRDALKPVQAAEVWKLLELQRHAMLMYTSCGWFFDELSGIETVQVIEYAGRAVQLAQEIFGDSIEAGFLQKLELAKSNLPEEGNGARIYEREVLPAMLNLERLGAHYAISSLFQNYPGCARVYSYSIERQLYRTMEAGQLKLAVGQARFTSGVTQESQMLAFAALHLGGHNVRAKVCTRCEREQLERLAQAMEEAFSRADLAEVLRLMDEGFSSQPYSLRSLFKDEQRKILDLILRSSLDEAEVAYRQIYEHHAPLMRFLADLRIPPAKPLKAAAEYALNSHLRHAFAAESLDLVKIRSLMEEVHATGADLDTTTIEFTLRKNLERMAAALAERPGALEVLVRLEEAVHMARSLPFPIVLWTIQNHCYQVLQDVYSSMAQKAKLGNVTAKTWVEHFRRLAEDLSLRMLE